MHQTHPIAPMKDHPLAELNLTPRQRLDLALSVIQALPRPQPAWSQRDLASLAGVSRRLVQQREHAALAKLRRAARKSP